MAKTIKPPVTKRTIDAIALEAGKMPPHSPDLEKAVLGALMLEREAIIEVQGLLSPKTFHNEMHEKIFAAIQALSLKHEPIDMLTVAEELKQNGALDEVGGPYYLSQLTMTVGSAAHVEYHAKLLAQKYIQRQLITVSSEIQRDAFEEDAMIDELLDGAQQKIFEIAEGNIHRETEHVRTVIGKALKELEEMQSRPDGLSGTPSGFSELDRVTQGWQPSDLVIVAARPSMGKTAFVLSMARNMAVDHNIPVAFFSLEMSSEQLVKRLMASEADISSEKIRGGKKMEPYEWKQLELGLDKLQNAQLYIDDTPALSIFEFRSKARKLVSAHGVKAIVIDYLQLMAGPPDLRGMREQEVSAISRSLKAIAKELCIPVLALSQLNRSVETRGGNKRPQLSDLRESGAIEQDADIVIFIHRPEYYGLNEDTDGRSTAGLAEIIIAKHRNGAIGDVNLRFIQNQAKFTDWMDNALPVESPFHVTTTAGNGNTIPSKMNDKKKHQNQPAHDVMPYNKEYDILPPNPSAPAPF
jgi:replicative DNA helicase